MSDEQTSIQRIIDDYKTIGAGQLSCYNSEHAQEQAARLRELGYNPMVDGSSVYLAG